MTWRLTTGAGGWTRATAVPVTLTRSGATTVPDTIGAL